MPEDISPLKGFPPTEAVWRLLKLKGYKQNLQAFQEAYLVDGTLESLVLPFEIEGIQARMAVLQVDEVAFLEMPTLVQIKDGSWVFLRNRDRKGLQLEGSDGKHWIPIEGLARILGGPALDLSPSLPEGETLWARLKTLLGLQKGTLIQIAMATVMLQLLALVVPEITSVVMNQALPDGAWSTLKLVAAGVLLVAAFQAWTGWIRERMLLYLATRLETSVELGFLEHLLRLPFPFLQKKTLGDMLQAFGGLTAARELLAERALGALLDGAMAVVYLVVMGFKILAPTVVVVLVAASMVGVAVLVGRSQSKQQAMEVEAQAKERGYLTELIAGIGTVKAAGAERQGLHRWLDRFQQELAFNLKKNRLSLWSEVGLSTLQQVMTVVLLIWGGNLALKGELQIGTLFAFMQLASGFLGAVFGVVNAYLMLVVLRPQLAKAQEILEVNREKRSLHMGGGIQELNGPVVMEDVWFRYTPEGPWILKGYNLRVEPGGKFTLTGPSGFGKSTILRLLAGLYAPEKGTISIGGLSPQAARHKILYLPQFVQLYGGSIIENLRVLSGGAPLERLLTASEQTGLHNLVATFPMNYNTVLPHGGRNLSGGQRQLIALTGALASGRGLMVLDEATANMDGSLGGASALLLDNAVCTLISARHVSNLTKPGHQE
jgi:ABC-type bacteriocin/lantibiotic exporter with double-glycine peptidase domain